MGHILVIDEEERGLAGVLKRIFEPAHTVIAWRDMSVVLSVLSTGSRFDAIVCRSTWAKIFHDLVRGWDAEQARNVLFIGEPDLRAQLSGLPSRFLTEPFLLVELREAVEGLLGS